MSPTNKPPFGYARRTNRLDDGPARRRPSEENEGCLPACELRHQGHLIGLLFGPAGHKGERHDPVVTEQ